MALMHLRFIALCRGEEKKPHKNHAQQFRLNRVLLRFGDVSGTILRRFARKRIWMRLNGIRIEYLHGFTKVDHLYEFVNLLVVMIVAEYEQSVLDASCPGQTHYGMPEVHNARVDLLTTHAH